MNSEVLTPDEAFGVFMLIVFVVGTVVLAWNAQPLDDEDPWDYW